MAKHIGERIRIYRLDSEGQVRRTTGVIKEETPTAIVLTGNTEIPRSSILMDRQDGGR